MTEAAGPRDKPLTPANLKMMVEVGKFCGQAAAGMPAAAMHAAFHELVRTIEAHFTEEEALMARDRFPSQTHKLLHSVILAELESLHESLKDKGIAFDKSQLSRLRRMFVADGEQSGILEDRLRRDG